MIAEIFLIFLFILAWPSLDLKCGLGQIVHSSIKVSEVVTSVSPLDLESLHFYSKVTLIQLLKACSWNDWKQ